MPTAKPTPEEEAPEAEEEAPEDESEDSAEDSDSEGEGESGETEPEEKPWQLTQGEWEWMKQQITEANKKKAAPPSKPKKEAPQASGSVVVHAEATPEQKKPLSRREKRHGKKQAKRGQPLA